MQINQLEKNAIFLTKIEKIVPLGDDLSSDSLVDDDAQGVRSDVVNSSGLAVVYFVRHTFLYTTVTLKKIITY